MRHQITSRASFNVCPLQQVTSKQINRCCKKGTVPVNGDGYFVHPPKMDLLLLKLLVL